MNYIHIKNLEKYHPGYKDRNLQWCKAYFTMLNAEPEFEMLSEIDKWRFLAFIMLELQMKKPIPLDEKYLERKGFDLNLRPISLTIQMLHNFIEIVTEEKNLCNTDKDKEKDKEEEIYKEKYKNSKIYQFLTGNIYFKNIKYPARLIHRLIEAYKNEELILYYLKKMDSWLLANPKREKKNYEKFILNWLKKEEEKIKVQNVINHLSRKKGV